MRHILFSLSLLSVFASFAGQINNTQLFNAEQKVNGLELNPLVIGMSDLKIQIANLSSIEEQLLAKSQLLTLLSLQLPTEEQRAWVLEQYHSIDNLTIANPDHPKQLIEIINIARQARNTELEWKIINEGIIIQNNLSVQNWHWPLFVKAPTEIEYRALAKKILVVDELTISWLQQQLIEQALTKASNRLLAILIKRRSNPLLLHQLWQNPSDEYSYQVLQHIPSLLSLEKAIEQLTLACENDKLESQALLLLVKHFQHHDKAQSFLLKKLQQPKSAWYAAAALSQASNSKLQDKMAALAQSSNNKAIKFAVENLSDRDIKE